MGAAFALAAVVALCAAWVGAYISSTRWVEHTLEVRQQLYDWRAALVDADASVRAYVSGGQPAVLESYEPALKRERAAAITTRRLVDDNPSQVQNVEATDRQAQTAIEDLRALVTLGKAGHRDEALARVESPEVRQHMDAFRADIHAVRAEEERLLVERRAEATSRGRLALAGAHLVVKATAASR